MRTRKKDLYNMLSKINKAAGFGEHPKYATIGSYDLAWNCGGVKLVRYVLSNGTIQSISKRYCPKKECLNVMNAFLIGMELSTERK